MVNKTPVMRGGIYIVSKIAYGSYLGNARGQFSVISSFTIGYLMNLAKV